MQKYSPIADLVCNMKNKYVCTHTKDSELISTLKYSKTLKKIHMAESLIRVHLFALK